MHNTCVRIRLYLFLWMDTSSKSIWDFVPRFNWAKHRGKSQCSISFNVNVWCSHRVCSIPVAMLRLWVEWSIPKG